ncbi:kinase domain protein [Aspergillus ellipticus CBS 707.79]|uniref:non-specific serine/threonine protein kinase n=1 Tax=Aspergillus ellipticus CBS 707.79 TaxID=1448320 RepID=A0A319DS70_9EURO|nr:kinase domain protein [Aspergillus ellipticus CBS 707.79]
MKSLWGVWKNNPHQKPPSRKHTNVSQLNIPTEARIEEETLPHYRADNYYPVKIGDIFKERYQITGKLGYGAYSTSWLCRDLQDRSFAVIKVSTFLSNFPSATDRERRIYEHLANINSSHVGQPLIRQLYDSFDIEGPVGQHCCLVLQPMRMTLLEMMGLNTKPFGIPLLKMTVKRLLLALDFLHTEASIVHTDLKTDNLMLTLENVDVLEAFAEAESDNPSPRKINDEFSLIYRSRKLCRPAGDKGYGLPVLCDLGEARIGKRHESGPFIQPHIYRAPEVIFEMPWDSSIDIWNLAGLIWDLFEGEHLFGNIFDNNGGHDPFKHLALMVALIGPPPADYVRRSETTEQCFNIDGSWIAHKEAVVPSVSLESSEKRLSGQEKKEFIRFIRSMLRWLPEERKTARQLLEDPWLF